MRILLLGGEGFLGKGLQRELSMRKQEFMSLDKNDIDLVDSSNTNILADVLKSFDKVVILASKLGAKLFETNSKYAAEYNMIIHKNVFKALQISSLRQNTAFDVTYYSTSEVFNSQENANAYITDSTDYSFDYSNPRHLYAYNKWQAELDYFNLQAENPKILSAVKIVRPFNIFGRNQKRGVVYDMIKSALAEGEIYYANDTTRTLTDIDYASRMSADTILANRNEKVNVADDRNSLTMEALAHIIADILNIKCTFIELPPDRSIRYRNTSKINADIELTQSLMEKHVIELANQVKSSF